MVVCTLCIAESKTHVLAIKLAALRNVHLVQLNPIITKPVLPDISFEALSPAAIKSAVFCHVTSCYCFGVTWCFHLQSREIE